jgi:hypothetical protein
VDVHNGPVSSALVVAKERPGIIATFVNFGTMIPIKTYITAMTVVYAERAEVLGKTSSIARCVIYRGLDDSLTFLFRPVVLACQWQWSTPINALNEFLTATARFAENICSTPHPAWSSCYAVIAYTRHVGMST